MHSFFLVAAVDASLGLGDIVDGGSIQDEEALKAALAGALQVAKAAAEACLDQDNKCLPTTLKENCTQDMYDSLEGNPLCAEKPSSDDSTDSGSADDSTDSGSADDSKNSGSSDDSTDSGSSNDSTNSGSSNDSTNSGSSDGSTNSGAEYAKLTSFVFAAVLVMSF